MHEGEDAFTRFDTNKDGRVCWNEWRSQMFHEAPQKPQYKDGQKIRWGQARFLQGCPPYFPGTRHSCFTSEPRPLSHVALYLTSVRPSRPIPCARIDNCRFWCFCSCSCSCCSWCARVYDPSGLEDHEVNPEDIKQMEEMFKEFDTDKDEYILESDILKVSNASAPRLVPRLAPGFFHPSPLLVSSSLNLF